MIRWTPFDQEKPSSSGIEYEVIAAHGFQLTLQWDGYGWREPDVYQRDGVTHTNWERVYYPITFWRWVPKEPK